MTHRWIEQLEDGTRRYSNYTRYKPLSAEERRYAVRKPDTPGALMYQGCWYLPLVLSPVDQRGMPLTRPDTDAYEHMAKPRKCKCEVCKRPESEIWKDKWRRGVRLRTVP
jgi:hypothetical protein